MSDTQYGDIARGLVEMAGINYPTFSDVESHLANPEIMNTIACM
jgi:hypothetical protein